MSFRTNFFYTQTQSIHHKNTKSNKFYLLIFFTFLFSQLLTASFNIANAASEKTCLDNYPLTLCEENSTNTLNKVSLLQLVNPKGIINEEREKDSAFIKTTCSNMIDSLTNLKFYQGKNKDKNIDKNKTKKELQNPSDSTPSPSVVSFYNTGEFFYDSNKYYPHFFNIGLYFVVQEKGSDKYKMYRCPNSGYQKVDAKYLDQLRNDKIDLTKKCKLTEKTTNEIKLTDSNHEIQFYGNDVLDPQNFILTDKDTSGFPLSQLNINLKKNTVGRRFDNLKCKISADENTLSPSTSPSTAPQKQGSGSSAR